MLKGCAEDVHNLLKIGVVVGARLYTFIVRWFSSAYQLVGQLVVIPASPLFSSTWLYPAKKSLFHLLRLSFTHNPHPLLLPKAKDIKEF